MNMKKLICIMLVAFLFMPAFSAEEKAVKMQFIYHFENIKLEKNDKGYIVKINGCQQHEINGYIIPVKPLHILIPYGKDVKEIRVSGDEHFLGFYNLKREKPLYIGNTKLLPKIGEAIKKKYEYVGVYGLRGYKILVMNLIPVEYKNGMLFYYDKIKVEIELKDGKVNGLYRGLEKDKEWVKRYVDNKWVLDTYPVKSYDRKYDYLIITAEKFVDAFKPFAEYKESKQIKTKIVSVEEIISNSSFWNSTDLFNDTQAKIRRFIRWAYLNWGIDYVLLGGDGDVMNKSSNIIPPRYLYATCVGLPLGETQEVLEGYIPSDVYYACLDGNFNTDMDNKWGENATGNDVSDEDEADLFAEVWVGRACVDKVKEIENFIHKTEAYEQTNDSYIIQILLLGEYLGFGGEAEWGGNHKDRIKPYIPPIYNITTLYDRENRWEKEELIALLNKGIHVVNHDGHGWTTYALKMVNSDLKALKNTKYFFLYSQTCLAGSFDNWYPEDRYYEDDCFAEHLAFDEHGAFACIMNSRYGLGRENSTDSPGQRYDESFFKAVFQENIRELGRANHYSKEDNVWRINENGMRWVYYETNLFGDPQVALKEPYEKVNISIDLQKPLNGIYILDYGPIFPTLSSTIIIGDITIKANVTTEPSGKLQKVNLYIDGILKASFENENIAWKWEEKAFGEHKICIEAIARNGKVERAEKAVYIFNL